MTNENDLIQKLMVSKQIMQKHDTIGRGNTRNVNFNVPEVEEYNAPQATYNIPKEMIGESELTQTRPYNPTQPVSKDRIMSSKLPDEIKQLMMEHPIVQPNNSLNGGSSISPELAEKASRLMNVNAKGQPLNETPQRKQVQTQNYGISADDIKNIVRETVEEVLKENGLMVESTKKSNDVFKFRVGQHMFEGKVTKVRKISE